MADLNENGEWLRMVLEEQDTTEYIASPIPSPVDAQLNAIIQTFRTMNVAQRTAFITTFHSAHTESLLIMFSERMANVALHQKSEQFLYAGIIAFALADFSDNRGNSLNLAMVYRSAVKLELTHKRFSLMPQRSLYQKQPPFYGNILGTRPQPTWRKNRGQASSKLWLRMDFGINVSGTFPLPNTPSICCLSR